MSFEYIVRPFETPGSHGRIVIPSTPSGTERATLTWGAKIAPNSIPKAKSLGVNVECCNEVSTEQTRSGDDITITATDNPENYITVRRAKEVKLTKKESNDCDDWLSNNSYVASGVKEAFSEMSSLIHASDSAFKPSGSTADCKQTLKLNPNTGPA
jgi:hypothetical protein